MKNSCPTILKNSLKMNKIISLSIILFIVISCGSRQKSSKTSNMESLPVVSAEAIDVFALFDSTARTLPAHRIADQILTTEEAMQNAFPNSTDDFLHETTSASKAFYYPGDDIKDDNYVKMIQLRYNYATVLNQVLHALEWFERMATGVDVESTKADTLRWIKQSRPTIPLSELEKALPDPTARNHAEKLLAAYSRFNGDTNEGGKFDTAFTDYIDYFNSLPGAINQDYVDAFKNEFWEWYDKQAIVPEIDELVRMNMMNKPEHLPDNYQLENLKYAIQAETNIDKRAILALEYIKFHPGGRLGGAELLGEIIESGVYTKYLLETWISWRANVQMEHSPSSFSVIANNYYDAVRCKCIDTIVRHCIQTDDKKAECLLENLVCCEIVHRMASIAGNSSFATAAGLAYNDFIHPRLLENEQ